MNIPTNPYGITYAPQLGWCCPKCSRVYSPSTSECWSCNSQNRPYNNPITCTTTGKNSTQETLPIFDNSEIKFNHPCDNLNYTLGTDGVWHKKKDDEKDK